MRKLLLSLLSVSIAPYALAQTIVLRGAVTDPTGAAIPGAVVTIGAAGTPAKTASADELGRYSIPGLQAGKYTFRVTSTGFANFERIVNLGGSAPIQFDVKMLLASEKQEITVTDTIQVDLDPSRNVGALVLKAEDLAMLSDNPEDLQSDLQALAGPAAGPNGGQIFIDGFSGGRIPPKESIREVRINSNPFSAEYDRIGFGRIEIFTKPGSDKYRGQAFFSFADAVFNARNPFSTIRPDYQQKFYGGNFSGPLGKKASFFLDAERRNVDEAATINATILDSSFQPTIFSTAIVNPQTRNSIGTRFDYALNANNTIVGRYSFLNGGQENAGLGTFTLPSRASVNSNHDHTVQITETAVLGAKAINELRFQFIGQRNDQTADASTPAITVIDSFNGGGATYASNYTNENRYEIANSTSITHKTHLFKVGFRLRTVRQDDFSNQGYNGSYIFSSLRAYQLQVQGMANGLTNAQIRAQGGGPSQFTLSAGSPDIGVTQWDGGFFFTDDWRARQNLTVSYGLRYETQNNISDRTNFAPRVGLAYGIGKPGAFGRPTTVLRLGWGIFYERFGEDLTLTARRLDGIVQQQFIVAQPNFYPTVPTPESLNANRQPQAIRLVDQNLRAPALYQTAVGIERSLPKNITLAINYTNSRGVHNTRSRNINAPLPNGTFPYGREAGNLYLYESTGEFKQNQLIVNSSARMGTKFMMFGFYMLNFARGNFDGSNGFPANQYDLGPEWGRTMFDQRHRMVLGGNYNLRYGVSLSPFVMANSGGPYNITIGRDVNGDAQFTDRPSLASGPGTGIVQAPWGQYFNTNPAPGEAILARNYGQAPGQFTVNLGVRKTWSFGKSPEQAANGMPDGPRLFGGMPGGGGPPGGGGMRGGGGPGGPGGGGPMGMMGGAAAGKRFGLTLSVQARNILNRTNLGAPVGTLTSTLFGQSNSLAGGFGPMGGSQTANRSLNLQLRFTF